MSDTPKVYETLRYMACRERETGHELKAILLEEIAKEVEEA